MSTLIGHVTDNNILTSSLAEFDVKVDEVHQSLLADRIRIHRDSSFGKLIRDARQIALRFYVAPNDSYEHEELFTLVDTLRIISAIRTCRDDDKALKVIRIICKKNVKLSEPEQSQGKDLLFELELFHRIRIHGNQVRLDEPDLIADFGFGDYAIACKKINSMKGIEAQLQKGNEQLERQPIHGLIALNIDKYLQLSKLPRANSSTELLDIAKLKIQEFIGEYQEQLRTIRGKKSDGIFISLTIPGLVRRADRLALFQVSHATIWHPVEIDETTKFRLLKAHSALEKLRV